MSDILHRLPEFFGNHSLLVMIFVVVLVMLISNEAARLFRGYRELTPAALTQLINRENPLLVDLSPIADFAKGHIPGAKNIVVSAFDPQSQDLAKLKDLPVALYCRAGTASATAAGRLVKAGFKQVFWLGGGLASWQQADLPIAKGNK